MRCSCPYTHPLCCSHGCTWRRRVCVHRRLCFPAVRRLGGWNHVDHRRHYATVRPHTLRAVDWPAPGSTCTPIIPSLCASAGCCNHPQVAVASTVLMYGSKQHISPAHRPGKVWLRCCLVVTRPDIRIIHPHPHPTPSLSLSSLDSAATSMWQPSDERTEHAHEAAVDHEACEAVVPDTMAVENDFDFPPAPSIPDSNFPPAPSLPSPSVPSVSDDTVWLKAEAAEGAGFRVRATHTPSPVKCGVLPWRQGPSLAAGSIVAKAKTKATAS